MYFAKKFYYLTIYLNEHSCVVWVFDDEMTRSQNSLHFFRSNENNNSLNHRETMKKNTKIKL